MINDLKNFRQKIKRYHAGKKDVLCSVNVLRYESDIILIGGEPVKTTESCRKQILTLGGIPTPFFNDCLTAKERETVFNRVFSGMDGKEWLFRFNKDILYSILSSRYRCLDNILVLDMINEIQKNGLKMKPATVVLDPDFSIFRFIPEDIDGRELIPAITATNSETGKGQFRIWAGTYRLICSNGLIAEVKTSGSNFIHIGAKEMVFPDIAAILSRSNDFTLRLEKSKTQYINSSKKTDLLLRLSSALGTEVAKDTVQVANSSYNSGRTVFDFVNAMTQVAQTYQPHQQSLIEQYAGRMLMQ